MELFFSNGKVKRFVLLCERRVDYLMYLFGPLVDVTLEMAPQPVHVTKMSSACVMRIERIGLNRRDGTELAKLYRWLLQYHTIHCGGGCDELSLPSLRL